MFTVRQAAEVLEISEGEVRRLISVGELAAERAGERVWLVDESSVRRRASKRPGRGRPWLAAKAWAALWKLSGLPADWLTGVEATRLRQQLTEVTADELALATRRRSDVVSGRALPEYLDRIAGTTGIVRTGVTAAAEVGADLVSTGTVDVYTGAARRLDLIARYGIETDSQNPNVVIRVPAGDLPLLEGLDTMPVAVVAADLLSSTEPRAARAGRELLNDLLEASR